MPKFKIFRSVQEIQMARLMKSRWQGSRNPDSKVQEFRWQYSRNTNGKDQEIQMEKF